MHRPIFGHSFAVLVAPILVSVLVFNFLNKKKVSARRNAKDADAGASANSGGSSSSPVETNDGASCSSPTETDNSPSSASTASTGNSYEVFLSFRGPDTRDGFTSHLYKELLKVGVHAFRDDDELPLGKSVGPELMAAIKNSKILIPILSVTYGESSWCLDELVRIMECEKNKEQMVLPIFYKVKPAEVGHQTGSFGKAFSEREKRLHKRNFDSTILGNWKKSLAEVSKLKGYEAIGNEAELVELIVREVLRELKKKFELVVPEKLVGIESPMKEVLEFVNNKSHVTLFVGIYGMGGIGKTTLAKAIYNKLFNQFEHHSFIADVRESSRNGVHYLQKQLLRDILQQEIEVCNKDDGAKSISSRCKGKKVIILLDDVDNIAQLHYLAGKRDWFSLGSIIIITTRDLKILEDVGVDHRHERKELDCDQSLILFSRHAFRRDSPPNDFEGLTREVVPIAGGLPLCLEVFGSLLHGKDSTRWIETVKKLKIVPPLEVKEKLRVSYAALDYRQQQIFLDIACFLIGIDCRIAYYMWDACNFFPGEGIEVLICMSLIKVGDDHTLRMHDQLRDLGRDIVREGNLQQPWCCSRIWDPEVALKVLKGNKGTDKIEAINLSEDSWEGFGKSTDIYTEKQFKNLLCLRFLNLERAHLRGDFEGSMEELKWLRWSYCPGDAEVKNFHVKELAVLEMSWSLIDEKWEGWNSFMMAEKLKVLDLSYSSYLENTNFLSAFKNLEVLILNHCSSLEQIDSSIGEMKALLRLDLFMCTRLEELPPEIGKLKALEQLLLSYTEALSALPESIGSLENLKILDISHSGIQELPNSIGRLRKLRELIAFDCRELKGKMQESMCNLSSLRRLNFRDCEELQSLSDLPSSLMDLYITCQSHELPSLDHLTHLKRLGVYNCKSLKCIQALPSKLPESLNTPFKLETLEVTGCGSIETLDVSQFVNLRTLSVRDCFVLIEVRGLNRLMCLEELTVEHCGLKRLDLPNSCLKILEVHDCDGLVEIQDLDRLKFLESLIVSGCTSIERLFLPKSGGMKELYATDCINLAKIEGVNTLELYIKECTLIETLDLSKSERLKALEAEGCKKLAVIQDLDRLEFLESLTISGCTSIERLLLPESRSLKKLNASFLKILAMIQGIDRLECLEVLHIEGLTSIERLDLPKSGSMKELYAGGCENLAKIEGLDALEFLEKLHINECTSFERLYLPKSETLKELDTEGCKNLVEIQGLDRLEVLEILNIKGCTSIERLDLSKSGKLKKLKAGGCKNLAEIQNLDRLEFLKSLHISGCTSIERLGLKKTTILKTLYAESCNKLAEIQGLNGLVFLEELNIEGCTSIKRLDLPKSGRLRALDAGHCENLVEIQGLDMLDFLEKLRIIGCKSLKTDLKSYEWRIYKEKLFGMTESRSDYPYDLDEYYTENDPHFSKEGT